MSKKIAIGLLTLWVLFGGLVSHASAATEGLSLPQLVELLISIDVIAPDKIEAARAFISGNSNPATAQATSTQTTVISSCGEITRSGTYVVDRNLQININNVPCLNVHDTENVHISCNNRSIKSVDDAILILRVKDFSIRSCELESGNGNRGLSIKNARDGEVANNKITSTMRVTDSVGTKILRNDINGEYKQYYTIGSRIDGNTINSWYPPFGTITPSAAGVLSIYGSNNTIINNDINGRSPGVHTPKVGADDGIILGDEDRDIVTQNTIYNIWDCGVETLGLISNTTISNNSIKNAGVCGIGGWHWNSFKGNTIANNTVNDAPLLFLFYIEGGLRNQGEDRSHITGEDKEHITPATDKIYFKDNVFENNKFINPRPKNTYLRYSESASIIMNRVFDVKSFQRQPTNADYVLGNNIFKNNDFSLVLDTPNFSPDSMIVDGGGNICPGAYPIQCSGATPLISSVTVSVDKSIIQVGETVTVRANISTSGSRLIYYGIQISVNGGSWENQSRWSTIRSSDSQSDTLALLFSENYIGTVAFRTYATATLDSGATYTYSSPTNVTVNAYVKGPTINTYSISPTPVTEGQSITISGYASRGSSCITKHRAVIVGSQTPPWATTTERWTPVGCVSSVTLSGSVGTAKNDYSFYKGPGDYIMKWEVVDQNSLKDEKNFNITVNPAPTSINASQSNLGSTLISFDKIMKLFNVLR